MPTKLKRKELYDLVWERPMTKVSADLGLSDAGLRKICERHRVPVPGRGYWAKLAAGKPAAKSPFREISDTALNCILIQASPLASLAQDIQLARINARKAVKSTQTVNISAGSAGSMVDRQLGVSETRGSDTPSTRHAKRSPWPHF